MQLDNHDLPMAPPQPSIMSINSAPSLEWAGLIDISTIALRSAELAPLLGMAKPIRIKVNALEGLDTAGWQLLLAAARELHRHGGSLVLDGVPSWMHEDAAALGVQAHLATMCEASVEAVQ